MEGKFAEPENTFASRTKWQDITNLSKVTSTNIRSEFECYPQVHCCSSGQKHVRQRLEEKKLGAISMKMENREMPN
jgi:hypothetical protein